MSRRLSKWIFKLIGWRNTGTIPTARKCVIVVIPHTSAWDFPIGILSRSISGLDVKFVGKKELFKFPIKGILTWLGGYPVDRERNTNFIDAVVQIFNSKEDLNICITPEGTRKKVTVLKRGFYYIAKGANVPIVLVKFDGKNKEVNWHPAYYLTDDFNTEMAKIHEYFKDVQGIAAANSFDSPYKPKNCTNTAE